MTNYTKGTKSRIKIAPNSAAINGVNKRATGVQRRIQQQVKKIRS